MTVKQLPTLFVQAALVATATILAIVLVSKFVAPIPISVSQTTTQKDSAFVASGKSSIGTSPDQAEVTLGISKKENDLKTAQSDANGIINSITQKLTGMGISKDNIKTQNYSINPVYDYQKSPQAITGYSVDISLNVTLKEADFGKLNDVVDTATATGANQVGNIQFTLSDQKEKEIRSQAREEAIKDARENASELAHLSGVQLGKVINVSENMDGGAQPVPMYKAANLAATDQAVAPTAVQPGSTLYNYSVTLSYETL